MNTFLMQFKNKKLYELKLNFIRNRDYNFETVPKRFFYITKYLSQVNKNQTIPSP